ncbi:IS630 family transposase [Syntrophorhabdus aromaticivorans]|nr:IS630 family transposase [Syntrophorhabdus aromaticivorans]
MEKIDGRTLKQEVQQALRNQVIRLRKQGKKNKDVAEFLGISPQHSSTLWQKYLQGGKKEIILGTRGRRHGEKRTLTEEQEHHIQKLIVDKTPDQLRFPFALWTRDAVRELIGRQYKITMPIRTVGEYLKRWGFTPQKPVKRAREQNPKAVERWLKEEYPAIAAKAKKEKAEIYWGDETGIQNEANRVRGYGLKGKTPVLRVTAKRAHISMISAITNEGKVRFMVYKEAMTQQKLITFMRRLIRDAGRRIYLILDNLKPHHGKNVTKWLDKHKKEIAVFYLPPCAPEVNPDEYLNGDLKTKVHSGTLAIAESDLKHKT